MSFGRIFWFEVIIALLASCFVVVTSLVACVLVFYRFKKTICSIVSSCCIFPGVAVLSLVFLLVVPLVLLFCFGSVCLPLLVLLFAFQGVTNGVF